MKRMPIGIESFAEMINENYYFVDKTLFIKDLSFPAIHLPPLRWEMNGVA